MMDSCCLRFHYLLDLLIVTFPEEEEEEKNNTRNVKNSVSSCSVSHDNLLFLIINTGKKVWDNTSH